MKSELLTKSEEGRLKELESQIESNIALVGRALFEIRESRLYRLTHSTFEDYCQERLGMNRRYIDRQIQAVEVINNLSPIGTHLPTSERQARPLATLPKEDQPKAWEKAQDIAKEEGKPLAARHVEKAVSELHPKEEPAQEVEVVNDFPAECIPEAGVALVYARTALDALNKIPKRDPSRKKAITLISEWVSANK